MAALEVDQNPFQPAQAPGMNSNSFANLQIWPRLARHLGYCGGLKGLDLAIVHRRRHPPASHHLQNAWRNGYRSTLRIVESTKNIAWKKRMLYFLLSVRPLPDRLVPRKKALKTLIF